MKSDQELDALFAEMREECWPDDRLVEWRTRVQERSARRRFAWFWLLPVPALAAAVFAFAILRPQPALAPPAMIAKAPAAATIAQPVPPVRTPVRRRPAAPPQTLLAKATPRGGTQFMRIMTDDPDVVILWAVNGNGEGQ
jgi:hypothetical protein